MTGRARLAALVLCCCLLVSALPGCARGDGGSGSGPGSGKLSIVCAIFPHYDWTLKILGDTAADADVTFLMSAGIDPHNFSPSAEDIAKIKSCALFIHTGGVSDEWLEGVIESKTVVVNTMSVLGEAVKEEEIIEGMEEEEEEEEEGPEYDEHVWLSLRNAEVICGAIASALSGLRPDDADVYAANLAAYTAELRSLDAAYQAAADAAPVKTLLFGDRFPFRYLVDDYGLSYYAAFPGCSAETEASFDTIIFLADKLNELGLRHIMIIDGSDGSLAGAIRSASLAKDQTILTLNSMQSVTAKDIAGGASYLSIMESNLEVLAEALS